MNPDEFKEESMGEQIAGMVINNLPDTEVHLIDAAPTTEFEVSLPFLKLRLTWKA